MRNIDNIYTVEIYGDNNSFTVEATVYYDPVEDWLTGRVYYNTMLDSVKLVHGNRRREVLPILTEEQQQQIINSIDQQNIEIRNEWLESRNEGVAC